MNDAEKRVAELLDRWLASVECHARYVKLDDAAYARVEAWPKHQRPTKWVVELAKQRVQELQSEADRRRQAGDGAFADALERMSFLTGLLGSQHLERFIPMASGTPTAAATPLADEQPRAARPMRKPIAATAKPAPTSQRRPAAPDPPAPKVSARSNTPRAARITTPRASTTRQPPPTDDPVTNQVIADAIRLLDWGREWPALAGLIARMADRPSESEIWRILRAHRERILGPARRAAR